jgi:PAS domain S-box-containing protein
MEFSETPTWENLLGFIEKLQGVIWEVDLATSSLTYISKQVEALLGYPHERWIQDRNFWLQVLHPEDALWVQSYQLPIQFGDQPLFIELRAIAADGRTVWLRNYLNPPNQIRSERLQGLTIDISSEKIEVKSLQQEIEQRNRFTALLTHEMRNPLAAISLAYSAITKLALSPETYTYLQIISRQAQTLSRVVDDLLDYNFLRYGALTLRKQRFNLDHVLNPLVAAFQLQIKPNNQLFIVDLEKKPIFIEADPIRLEQIISNLLDNSRKYTPLGGSIYLSTTLENNGWLKIVVKDTGVGIAPSTLPHVFSPFARFHEPVPGSKGIRKGLGIGLWLSQQLVTLHGGQIKVTSSGPHQGTEVEVILPHAGEAE